MCAGVCVQSGSQRAGERKREAWGGETSDDSKKKKKFGIFYKLVAHVPLLFSLLSIMQKRCFTTINASPNTFGFLLMKGENTVTTHAAFILREREDSETLSCDTTPPAVGGIVSCPSLLIGTYRFTAYYRVRATRKLAKIRGCFSFLYFMCVDKRRRRRIGKHVRRKEVRNIGK